MKSPLLISLFLALALVSCASKKDKEKEADMAAATETTQPAPTTMSSSDVAQITANWEPSRKEILNRLVEKYGQPNEATENMVIWHNNGPWAKTVLHSGTEIGGALEQFAMLNVPPEKLGDLALFNKSVSVDKTTGMISARNDREELNFLALNLSKEIVDGNMSAMEARRQYAQLSDTMERNQYMDTLNFGARAPSSVDDIEAEEEFDDTMDDEEDVE